MADCADSCHAERWVQASVYIQMLSKMSEIPYTLCLRKADEPRLNSWRCSFSIMLGVMVDWLTRVSTQWMTDAHHYSKRRCLDKVSQFCRNGKWALVRIEERPSLQLWFIDWKISIAWVCLSPWIKIAIVENQGSKKGLWPIRTRPELY